MAIKFIKGMVNSDPKTPIDTHLFPLVHENVDDVMKTLLETVDIV